MARRKQASVSGDVLMAFAEMMKFGLVLGAGMFRITIEIIRWMLKGMASVARLLADEMRRENAALEERRRERLEDECEEEWEEEEEDDLPPLLPPMEFRFIGDGELPEDDDDDDEDDDEDDGDDDEDEMDSAYAWMPGGSAEKAIAILERRLATLYERKERAEYINHIDDASWKKYTQTKAWRGLLWDIDYTEKKLALIENGLEGGAL